VRVVCHGPYRCCLLSFIDLSWRLRLLPLYDLDCPRKRVVCDRRSVLAVLELPSAAPPPMPACASSVSSANAVWQASLSNAALCALTLPPAFAANGWPCPRASSYSLSATSSLSPTPSPSASYSVTPYLTPTATASPSACPVLGAACSQASTTSTECRGTGSGSTYWPAFCNYTNTLYTPYSRVNAGTCITVPQTVSRWGTFLTVSIAFARRTSALLPPPFRHQMHGQPCTTQDPFACQDAFSSLVCADLQRVSACFRAACLPTQCTVTRV